MHESVREVGGYISAFAEEALADCLQRILACTSTPKHLGQAPPNQFSVALAATAAAHGAELLIKSAIAKEHPLLLFDSKLFNRAVPKDPHLELEHLFERETIAFQNLPYALWAATSAKITNPDLFEDFRKLRNKIEHFSVPPKEKVIDLTVRFLFEIVDPILREFWENDLLSLVRPFGVDALLGLVKRHVSDYSTPKWFASFNEAEEQAELNRLYSIADRQSELAAGAGKTFTQWCVQMSLIVPEECVDMANREAMRTSGNPDEKRTFSVMLSEDGTLPATHVGAHTAATREVADRFIRLLRRHGGEWSYSVVQSGTTEEQAGESFDELCHRLGLQRCVPR